MVRIALVSGLFLLALAITLPAQPGIEIEGSGIVGTEVQVHLTGDAGDFYLLYMGFFANPIQSWTGQILGIGPVTLPVFVGQFDATGRALYRFSVPNVPELVGKGMAFFQFETFELKILPPAIIAKAVSPGAYFVVAAEKSGQPTKFSLEGTDSVIGSMLDFHFKGQPNDFVLGYWGTIALPVLLPDSTIVAALPPVPFTPFPALLDARGDYKIRFQIPEVPALVGTNLCFQFQTYTFQLFPPALVLKDSSGCLLVTVKGKT